MKLEEAIKNRRSVRKFKNRTVPKLLIKKVIGAAMYAPSACNLQGWRFVVVNSQNLKNELVNYGGSVLIKNAPIGIIVLYDNRTLNFDYQDHIQSAAAAIQNIQLSAFSYGLGTCWICHLPAPNKIRKIFSIPKELTPIAYILLGYPKELPKSMPRKYLVEEIINYNHYSKKWPKEKINPLILKIKIIFSRIYSISPIFIKKYFLNYLLDKKFVKKFDN